MSTLLNVVSTTIHALPGLLCVGFSMSVVTMYTQVSVCVFDSAWNVRKMTDYAKFFFFFFFSFFCYAKKSKSWVGMCVCVGGGGGQYISFP